MSARQIVPGVYVSSLPTPFGSVNAYLIDSGELTLIDTGLPGDADKILAAVQEIGRRPADIHHILITHCHADHAGSVAILKQLTGAATYMHPLDAALVREGRSRRSMTPRPGLVARISYEFFTRVRPLPATLVPAAIEHEVHDDEVLPIAGGIRAIHVPGHCAGQLAFLWLKQGGVLFAADAVANVGGLSLNLGNESLEQAEESIIKIAGLAFETACFGHGDPIHHNASARFRQRKWGV